MCQIFTFYTPRRMLLKSRNSVFYFWITPFPLYIHCTHVEKSAVRVLDGEIIVEGKRKKMEEWWKKGKKGGREQGRKGGRERGGLDAGHDISESCNL